MKLDLDVLPIGPLKLNFGCASQRSDGLILDVLPRGPMELEFERASQRSDGIGIWTCFLEFQWNWKVLFKPMCGHFTLIPAK